MNPYPWREMKEPEAGVEQRIIDMKKNVYRDVGWMSRAERRTAKGTIKLLQSEVEALKLEIAILRETLGL